MRRLSTNDTADTNNSIKHTHIGCSARRKRNLKSARHFNNCDRIKLFIGYGTCLPESINCPVTKSFRNYTVIHGDDHRKTELRCISRTINELNILHEPVNLGRRFSIKAVVPSRQSSVEAIKPSNDASKEQPSLSVIPKPSRTAESMYFIAKGD